MGSHSIYPHMHTDINKAQQKPYSRSLNWILALIIHPCTLSPPLVCVYVCVSLYPRHLPAVLLSVSTIWLLPLLKERERRRARKSRGGGGGGEKLKNFWGTSSLRLSSSLTHSIWPSSSTLIFLLSWFCLSNFNLCVSSKSRPMTFGGGVFYRF